MRAVIIDDESHMRGSLRGLIQMYAPFIQIVDEADGVRTGLNLIDQIRPDLVFLDVEMGDGTGFDLLAQCQEVSFKVIFVTAHDAYAIKAFRFSAIDYLLKPVDPDDLVHALSKLSQDDIKSPKIEVETLVSNRSVATQDTKIVLKDVQNVYLVRLSEIIRCVSENNYTTFLLTDQRKILISKTLKEYEELFSDAGFLRIHQSHLINLQHFDRYSKAEGGAVYMKDGAMVPLSTRKRDQLMEALENL